MAMRLLVVIQLALNIYLLVHSIQNGSPIITRQFAQYPNTNTSWTYGIGRPLAGILLLTPFGLMPDCHQVFRWMYFLYVWWESNEIENLAFALLYFTSPLIHFASLQFSSVQSVLHFTSLHFTSLCLI